jgi:hypothetical protein
VCVDEKPVTLPEEVRDPIPRKPNVTTSTNVAAQPTHSAAWNPRPGAISPKSRSLIARNLPLARRRTSYAEAATFHLAMDHLIPTPERRWWHRFGEVKGGALWDRFTVHPKTW